MKKLELGSLLSSNHPSKMKFPMKEKEETDDTESKKKSIISLVLEKLKEKV